jgi:hypothetical protein
LAILDTVGAFVAAYNWADFLKDFAPNFAATFIGALLAIPFGLLLNRILQTYSAKYEVRIFKHALEGELGRSLDILANKESLSLSEALLPESGFLAAFLNSPKCTSMAPAHVIAAAVEYDYALRSLKEIFQIYDKSIGFQSLSELAPSLAVISRSGERLSREAMTRGTRLNTVLAQWSP